VIKERIVKTNYRCVAQLDGQRVWRFEGQEGQVIRTGGSRWLGDLDAQLHEPGTRVRVTTVTTTEILVQKKKPTRRLTQAQMAALEWASRSLPPTYDEFHPRTADNLVRAGLAERRFNGGAYRLCVTALGRERLTASTKVSR
jgi:hypothetical protein